MITSLYIHIPFCVQKCNYCDFSSFSGWQEEDQQRYIEALKQEMLLRKEEVEVVPKTIFIGGGTPSVLNAKILKDLLSFIEENYYITKDIEYTIECNPGTLDKEKLAIMKEHKVNRLSMGVQSDNDQVLKMLGRIHNIEEVRENYLLARAMGFDNINLDLMYGIPNQTLEQWENTLHNIVSLQPEHLSLYQLKIEEGTIFDRWYEEGKIEEFDDELALQMFERGEEILHQYGYHHYEISNYSLPNKESAHNKVYWQTKGYLGLGWGAHSFVPPVRSYNDCTYRQYLEHLESGQLPKQEKEVLTKQHQMEETMFMGLRISEGINLSLFQQRYGVKAEDVFAKAIHNCIKLQLIEEKNGWLKLTVKGRALGNLVFAQFIQ